MLYTCQLEELYENQNDWYREPLDHLTHSLNYLLNDAERLSFLVPEYAMLFYRYIYPFALHIKNVCSLDSQIIDPAFFCLSIAARKEILKTCCMFYSQIDRIYNESDIKHKKHHSFSYSLPFSNYINAVFEESLKEDEILMSPTKFLHQQFKVCKNTIHQSEAVNLFATTMTPLLFDTDVYFCEDPEIPSSLRKRWKIDSDFRNVQEGDRNSLQIDDRINDIQVIDDACKKLASLDIKNLLYLTQFCFECIIVSIQDSYHLINDGDKYSYWGNYTGSFASSLSRLYLATLEISRGNSLFQIDRFRKTCAVKLRKRESELTSHDMVQQLSLEKEKYVDILSTSKFSNEFAHFYSGNHKKSDLQNLLCSIWNKPGSGQFYEQLMSYSLICKFLNEYDDMYDPSIMSFKDKICLCIRKLEDLDYEDGEKLIRNGGEWYIPARILIEHRHITNISDFELFSTIIKNNRGHSTSNLQKFSSNFNLSDDDRFINTKKRGIPVDRFQRYIKIASVFEQLLVDLNL